jgi:hypothetical protein
VEHREVGALRRDGARGGDRLGRGGDRRAGAEDLVAERRERRGDAVLGAGDEAGEIAVDEAAAVAEAEQTYTARVIGNRLLRYRRDRAKRISRRVSPMLLPEGRMLEKSFSRWRA